MTSKGNDADALSVQAEAAVKRNDLGAAEDLYRKALETRPDQPGLMFALGSLLFNLGRPFDALQLLERCAALQPANPVVLQAFGAALHGVGRSDDALAAFSHAARVAPHDARPHLNVAKIYRENRNLAAAEKWLRAALAVQPDALEGLLELALLKFDAQLFDEAAALLRRAAIAAPLNADVSFQLAVTYLNLGDGQAAAAELARVEQFQPADPRIPRVRLMLCKSRQDNEGIVANARTVLSHTPTDLWAVTEFLDAASTEADKGEAHRILLAIIKEKPSDARAWQLLADIARDYETATQILEDGIEATGDVALRLARALSLPRIPVSRAQILAARQAMERHLDAIINGPDQRVNIFKRVFPVAFRLAYHGQNDRVLHEKIAKAHLKLAPDLDWTSPNSARKTPHKKIRIGFYSAHLIWHSVGRMMAGLIRDLDRARFEVIVIRPPGKADDFGESINRSADGVVTAPRNIETARAAIAQADLDILLYPDIGMEPFTYYMAFSRLARKQIVWPGHPVTTGLATFDAFISGESAEPADCDDHYTERLIKLSKVPIYDEARVTSADPGIRSELGLPDGTLYVCPMALPKFHPDFDGLVGRILEKDPRGKLVVFDPGGPNMEALRKRMSNSVPDLARKLIVLPYLNKQRFSDLLLAADAVLDTPHFSGSGTSRDAASVGSPIVTLEGAFMRGRLSTGMYIDMGLPHLALRSEDEYVDLALRLANDQALRENIGSEVKEACATLVLNRDILREFEDCFAEIAESP